MAFNFAVSSKNTNGAPLPANIADPEKYLILDGRTYGGYSCPDMLVSMEKSYHGKDWNQAQDALHQNGETMLTIRQFADFLNLLKSGKAYDGRGKAVDGKRLTSILNEIVKVRDPWRSEWLDAQFGEGTISYHIIENQMLKKIEEPLADYLSSDKQISMADWLKNANQHGLPRANAKAGNLYYFAPVKGRVARFYANSVGAYLGCGWDPSYSNSDLGVRAARKK